MKKVFNLMIALGLSILCQAQLVVYPALPNNKLKSSKYSVKVKLGNEAFRDSYTYEYAKNPGTGSSQNNTIDPYNVVTADKREILSDNHWTTVSYNNNGNSITFEVSVIGSAVNSCQVYPKRYAYSATISGGKALITVDKNEQYLYLVINNDKKDALFLFVDPLEVNPPTASSASVAYFGPGVHEIGERWNIPSNVNTVYIAGGAYVRGTISASNRSNIKVTGRGILSGEGYDYRDGAAGIPWGAVYFDGNGSNQIVEGITSMKPLHFHVTSRGQMTVRNIKCFSYNNTTDGVVGGVGTVCENSFFKVNDDVTKLYSDDMIFQDLVVYHQTNTPCFQFGWSGQSSKNCTIRRVDIVEDNHVVVGGGGIIGWASSDSPTNYQTGHVWSDIRADQGVSYIMDVNSGGSQGKVDITLKDFQIALTKSKSQLGAGDKKVTCQNVKIAGECVKTTEWADANNRVSVDNCSVSGGGVSVGNITNLNADISVCQSVKLTWSDVQGEAGYLIRRKASGETSFSGIANVNANTTTFTDITAIPNTNYQYELRPIDNTNVMVATSNIVSALPITCNSSGGGSSCIPVVKYPGGRMALSFDGNVHDDDDIIALPVSVAMIWAAGLKDKVAHLEYSNHVCNHGSESDGTPSFQGDDHVHMEASANGSVTRFGLDPAKVFDYSANGNAATQNFINAINASSAGDPLWIVAAGPMETVWRAINGSQVSKRQYITVISHSNWNQNHGDCGANSHTWSDMVSAFSANGVKFIQSCGYNSSDPCTQAELNGNFFPDQNISNGDNDFNTPIEKWHWMRDSQNQDLKWVFSRNPFGNKFDPSDCGMVYYLITGGPINGGAKKAGWAEAKELLENPCSSNPSDIANLTTISTLCESVKLNWTDVNGETGYRVRRKESNGVYVNIQDLAANATSFTDNSVEEGKDYVYMVRPMVNGVAVAVSNELSVRVPNCNVTAVDAVEGGFITLFPNPTTGIIQISADKDWMVFNVLGEILSRGSGSQIDISKQVSGIYFVEIDGQRVKVVKE